MHKLDDGIMPNKFLQYLYNVAVWLSQGINVFLGGDPDESLSSRLGKAERAHNVWAEEIVCPAVDWLVKLGTGQQRHCLKSIEEDEGKKTVWDWSK